MFTLSSILSLNAAALQHQPPVMVDALRHHSLLPARARPAFAKLFEATPPLATGDRVEGLISKITDYGFFVRIGHQQDMGLVHIRTLSRDRLDRDMIEDWIEQEVGPVGSKVEVEVLSLQHKGVKRTSLRLLDVITQQHMDDLVVCAKALSYIGQ